MKLGVLSDAHGKHSHVTAAVNLLREAGAEAFIFCGDAGSASALEALGGEEVYLVWGNVDDWDQPSLSSYATKLGLKPVAPGEVFELGGRRVAVCHGHERENLEERLVAAEACEYLFCGHTHQRRDARRGTVRIINPGALHRTNEKSVALVDLETDSVCFLRVDIP